MCLQIEYVKQTRAALNGEWVGGGGASRLTFEAHCQNVLKSSRVSPGESGLAELPFERSEAEFNCDGK